MNTCFVVFDDKRFELLLRFKVLLGKNCPSRTKMLYLIWICSHPRSLIRWWVIWWVPDFITFKILKIKHCESGFISLLLCNQNEDAPTLSGLFYWRWSRGACSKAWILKIKKKRSERLYSVWHTPLRDHARNPPPLHQLKNPAKGGIFCWCQSERGMR